MNEISEESAGGGNVEPYSVAELSNALKRSVEDNFGWVRVRGEISGFKRAASGHLYFALKDDKALLDAVCWRGTAGKLTVAPEDGLEVIASGKLTTYPARSRYQLVVQSLEVAGEGALLKLLEERKKKLAAEGLFDEARKRPLPYLPATIGVVTSPTGAVIRDILHRIAERFPRHVLVWPVLVQGERAAEQVARAIAGFNALAPDGAIPRPDLLIVARGGGSLEDLWAFNEEIVVRAAATSAIPLISAIGHETDVTLIDLAADRRAPTPSAAGEMAVPVRAELFEGLLGQEKRLMSASRRVLRERRTRLEGLARGLPDAPALLGAAAQRLDDWSERLANAERTTLRGRADHIEKLGYQLPRPRESLAEKRRQLAHAAAGLQPRALELHITQSIKQVGELGERMARAIRRRLAEQAERKENIYRLLNNFSYERVLERGFVLVRDAKARPVTSARALKPGMELTLTFQDGEAAAMATGKKAARPGPGPDSGPNEEGGEQGSLL
jgi:exodeoxyribonuclease VII large subunit